METWERFVLRYGARARNRDLAHVLGRDIDDVAALKRTGACWRSPRPLRFAELFSLWHGREPEDCDWPRPAKIGGAGYEWLAPELALIASLVGRLSPAQIAKVLTKRLRKVTGDARAERRRNAVQCAINRMGLQTKDVAGGITIADAGAEIGSVHIVRQAIASKTLRAFRAGRLLAIPREEWERWKASRTPPPPGYVQLSSICAQLGIKSDSKLPEYAALGYIETAILCRNPHVPRAHSAGRGSWYIDAKVARKLVRDRRAGRPMPWYGRPLPGNLEKTYALWQGRKHPARCAECAKIWGAAGAPRTFDEYWNRYSSLDFGAKRHLTRRWSEGLTPQQVAGFAGCSYTTVTNAIAAGVLPARRIGRSYFVTRTEATRWKARRCPSGEGRGSWVSIRVASETYGFSLAQLSRFLLAGDLTKRRERGVLYVSRHQCRVLRERIGYAPHTAARILGISLPRLLEEMKTISWRQAEGIPHATVQAIGKRLEVRQGYSIEEAASKLRVQPEWILLNAMRGLIRLVRSKRDRRRKIVTEAMLRRLQRLRARRRVAWRERLGPMWLNQSQAALDAAVSLTTIKRWRREGLHERETALGPHIHRRSLRARARRYWTGWGARFHRARRPAWLVASRSTSTGDRP